MTHHAPPPQLLLSDPLTLLDLAGDDDPLLPDQVLLLLFHLVTSSDAEPLPLTLVPWRRSPSSSATHWLGLTIESHDLGARPLLDGLAWWANRWSS
jgi:hypothetical protein